MLNSQLYQALTKACHLTGYFNGVKRGFPAYGVKVSNQGEPMTGTYVKSPLTKRTSLKINYWGETYNVCCPFCGDTRHRLQISHRWGEPDNNNPSPQDRKPSYHLMTCFNEECHKDGALSEHIKDAVSFLTQSKFYKQSPVQSVVTKVEESEVSEATLPGHVQLVSTLSDDHPARIFLKSRGHNPDALSKHFGVSWCDQSHNKALEHRLIIPIFGVDGSVMIGWQARLVHPDGSGDVKNYYRCKNTFCGETGYYAEKPTVCAVCQHTESKPTKVAKWLTYSKMQAAQHLFNKHAALSWNFAVVTEGPLDVIRLGTPKREDRPGPGVACFGHHLSKIQIERELKNWWYSKDKAIYLAFDGDMLEKTLKQQEILLKAGFMNVFVVPFKEDEDPGGLSHADLWQRIVMSGDPQFLGA